MNKPRPDESMHDFAPADLPGLMARHPVYFRPSWLQRANIGLLLLAMAALAVFAMIRLDITPDRFFNGLFRLGNFVMQMLPPNADGKCVGIEGRAAHHGENFSGARVHGHDGAIPAFQRLLGRNLQIDIDGEL